MKTSIIIFSVLATGIVGGEIKKEEKKQDSPKKDKKDESLKQDKRGLLDLGYGGYDLGYGAGSHDFGSNIENGGYQRLYDYGAKIITQTVSVSKPYPVTIERHVPVPVSVPVEKPYPVEVLKPYPVPVEKLVPYKVDNPIPYAVKVPVKIPIIQKVEIPVEKPYPVPVERPYPVPVPHPVVIEKKVPVLIHQHSGYDSGVSHGSSDGYGLNIGSFGSFGGNEGKYLYLKGLYNYGLAENVGYGKAFEDISGDSSNGNFNYGNYYTGGYNSGHDETALQDQYKDLSQTYDYGSSGYLGSNYGDEKYSYSGLFSGHGLNYDKSKYIPGLQYSEADSKFPQYSPYLQPYGVSHSFEGGKLSLDNTYLAQSLSPQSYYGENKDSSAFLHTQVSTSDSGGHLLNHNIDSLH